MKSLRLEIALACGLGLIAVAAFAPLALAPLMVASLAGLYALLRGAVSVRQAALMGFDWGLGCFLGGVSWVYVSMHDVGGMALPLAGVATMAFCGVLALFPALAMALFQRWVRGLGWGPEAAGFAALWTLGELARGTLFTGFPWLAVGYTQTPPSPLAGYAPVLGVYGLSFLTALLAALAVHMVTPAQLWRKVILLLVAALVLMGGAQLQNVDWTEPTGKPLRMSLLQGNIPQALKWDPANLHLSFETYLRLTREHPADLIVLPETAIPLLFDQIPGEVLDDLTRHGPVLMGTAMSRAGGEGYVNAAVGLDGRQGEMPRVLQVYAKRHLVPFGEYIPPGFDWFFMLVNIPMNGFSVGPPQQSPIELAGQRLMPNICYEDLFGEELIAGAAQSSILVNVSNTAWFGHSLAQPQHLQIARMRALETGRPMVRATNTGMTASITPRGEVAAVLAPFVADALEVTVQGTAGLTPYVRFGNGPVGGLVALALLSSVVLRRVSRMRQGRAA